MLVCIDGCMDGAKKSENIYYFRTSINLELFLTLLQLLRLNTAAMNQTGTGQIMNLLSIRSINNVTELHMDHAFYGNSLSRENIRIHSTVTVYIAQKISIKNHS